MPVPNILSTICSTRDINMTQAPYKLLSLVPKANYGYKEYWKPPLLIYEYLPSLRLLTSVTYLAERKLRVHT